MTRTQVRKTILQPLIYAALAALFVAQTANVPTARSGSAPAHPLAAHQISAR